MKLAGLPVLIALVVTVACARPLPTERPEAGMAELEGVTFTRIRGDHQVMTLQAPRAQLDIDGTRVTMEDLTGEAQESPDGGRFTVKAARVVANLERNTFVIEDARAADDHQRTLTSPRITFSADGGAVLAEPPVTLRGPNYELRSEHGARADVATEELELLGPVEAQVWPPGDGGKALPRER